MYFLLPEINRKSFLKRYLGILIRFVVFRFAFLFQCVNDSTSYDYYSINFIKKHPLMDTAVPTVGGRPLLVLSGTK